MKVFTRPYLQLVSDIGGAWTICISITAAAFFIALHSKKEVDEIFKNGIESMFNAA